jgi:ligand-binding SRPBCC domain-containing protein
MRSTAHTREIAVAGVTSGLIGLGQEVTWEATHFGVRQRLTSRITAFDRPFHFRDSQVRGAFKRFDHDHFFEKTSGEWTLRRYMTSLLQRRNKLIKQVAEEGTAV